MKKYDVIIAGSGPGGACAAKELAAGGLKVLLLERGDGAPVRGTALQGLGYLSVPNRSLYFTDGFLALTRALTVGGSSVVFHATAWEPDHAIFDRRGIDLRPHAAAVRKEIPAVPLPDALVGPRAMRLAAAARRLDHKWEKLDKFIFARKCRAGCGKCPLGCPYGAKWTARDMALEAVELGAELMAGARVTRVLTAGGRARGVEYVRGGRRHTAAAGIVISSAGGLGSPELLLASGVAGAGQNLFYDPFTVIFGSAAEKFSGGEVPMAMGAALPGEDCLLADMALPRAYYSLLAARAGRPDRLGAYPRQLALLVKTRDERGGRVDASGKPSKPFTPAERKRLERGCSRAAAILAAAGARDIFRSSWMASHPGGSCAIGEVTDKDLMTRVEGLYVCDASVIPGRCGRPPVLTLLALGKYLAGRLLK